MKNNSIANKRSGKKRNTTTAYQRNAYMIPLIIIGCLIPIIIRLHLYNPHLNQYIWFWDITKNSDFFLYYKQLFLILTSGIMIISLAYFIIVKKISFKIVPILIPLIIYAILAFISTLFSKYSSFGFTGINDQFESVFALLSYCTIVFYTYYFVKKEDDLKFFLKYLTISIMILAVLGLAQSFGHDFFATDIGKKTYIPSIYWDALDNFVFSFSKTTVYMTMYNPNYAGVYIAIIIPILISFIIVFRKLKEVIFYVLSLIALLICLYATGSGAGEISVVLSIFLILIFFRKYIFIHKKIYLPILGIIAILTIGVSIYKFDTIKQKFTNFFSLEPTDYNLTDIKTEDNLTITYKGNDLIISSYLESDQIFVELSDQSNAVIPHEMDPNSGKITISDERFSSIYMTPVKYQETICLDINIDGKDWFFSNQLGDNTFYYLNPKNRFDKIIKADSAIFTGYENIASGRGYIWSRTIPLLKKTLLLGTGADSFTLAYPQQDYVYLYNTGFEGQLLTKPHSMYLQTGVQTGILSLLALLAFYVMYFIGSIKLYWKGTFNSYFEKVGVAIFIGTISYMITGLTNDSTITVAPVFWVLISLGIAINHILKSNTNKVTTPIRN